MASNSPPLSLGLAQTSNSPPTVNITVTNNSPTETYTMLKWSSPLDPLALHLGLISVTIPSDSSPSTPFEVPRIMLKRAMPPPDDAFVILAPGESASQDIVFRDPVVDMDNLVSAATEASSSGASVVDVQIICGNFDEDEEVDRGGATVWVGKKREDLTEEEVSSLGRSGGDGVVRWRVKSEVLKLEIGS